MSKLLQSSLLLVAGIAIGLLAASIIDKLTTVELGGGVIVVDTRSEDSAKLVMIDNSANFNETAKQNNLEVFSYSYEISGEALLQLMRDNSVSSVCVLNGLRDSTKMDPADRVFIIAPINNQGHILRSGSSYVSNTINTTPFSFFNTPTVLPEFNADEFHPFDESITLFNNFEIFINNNQGIDQLNLDSIKGFIIDQGDLRRLLPSDNAGKARYDLRARFNLYVNDEGELVRGITLNSIELGTGNDIFSYPMAPLTDRRICPNNCDFF
ncbi:MAG: hypothetical protein IPI46_09660 [Bacteroidetes bacterium]|nr:hypothetical protein [Bacteroidota bacterium]